MKKYKIGFIQGVFDMFHIGHLNLIRKAKENCEYLIVGVNTDEFTMQYKSKTPIVPFEERIEIVSAIKYVDKAIKMDHRDKIKVSQENDINVIFMGDDWKNSDFYNEIEKKLKEYNVDIVYFPYTKGTSSTILREKVLHR